MKLLCKITLSLLLCLTLTASFAQAPTTTKQKLFAAYPNSISCTTAQFNDAFAFSEGQQVSLSFSDNFKFTGTVISNVSKYGNLQSIVIRSDIYDNTVFHLSKQTNADNTTNFVGRIINPNAVDGFEIRKDLVGNYKFEKTDTEKVLNECNL